MNESNSNFFLRNFLLLTVSPFYSCLYYRVNLLRSEYSSSMFKTISSSLVVVVVGVLFVQRSDQSYHHLAHTRNIVPSE